MARIAWLFLFVLLCIAIYFGWQAANREPVTLAPVVFEVEKEFVNPNLPTGEPTEGIVSGVEQAKAESPPALLQSEYNNLPSGEATELIVTGEAVDDPVQRNGYFVGDYSIGRGQLICVFDPVGNSGDVVSLVKYVLDKLPRWGLELRLKAYTDESIIVDEFKNGKCDGAILTGLKSRDFNKFVSTIEAVGAIPDEEVLRAALETILGLPEKTAHKFFRNGPYEVVGVLPAGGIYAFLRDKSWNKFESIQGKRIAVIEDDPVSQFMVRQVGGSPVVATTTSFAGKFNNGSVDIAFAPTAAYEPLELYRGLGDIGGIADMVFSQLTFQFLIRYERFPQHFGRNTRRSVLQSIDDAFDVVDRATKSIDPKYWVNLNPKDKPGYAAMMRRSRIELREKGIYDGKMLKILRKIRCKKNPTAAECAENLE